MNIIVRLSNSLTDILCEAIRYVLRLDECQKISSGSFFNGT